MANAALTNFRRNWRHDFGTQLATLTVLIATYSVLSTAVLMHQNLEQILGQWGEEVKVSVYLSDQITHEEKSNIEQYLSKSNMLSESKYLSKADAANYFKKRAGEYFPDLLSNLDFDNPLPASFELKMKEAVSSASRYNSVVEFAKKIESFEGVEDVSYGQGWVENYASVLKVFSMVSSVFVSVLLLGALFVVGNSIRNSLIQRKEEIEIMELFGATRKMIMWPYIFEGLLTGLIAAAFSLLVVFVVFRWQQSVFHGDLAFWFLKVKLTYLTPVRAIYILLCGGALGALGSYLWVRKTSSGWAAADSAAKWNT